MANYRVRIAVNNSEGREQAVVFNFTTVVDMEYSDMYRILCTLVKEEYHLRIIDGHKKPAKKIPMPFEKLCAVIKEWRFYETKKSRCIVEKHEWKYMFSLDFPCEPFLKCFHSDWGGTFFEITFEEKHLVEANYDSIKATFEKYGLDLCKSKTEGLWYSHSYLELTDLSKSKSILVRKRTTRYEWIDDIKKIEL